MDNDFKIPNITIKTENKYCPLIFKRGDFSLSVISEQYGLPKNSNNTIFIIPIREFLACGSIWQAINLSTIFWEKPAFNIERSYYDTQRTKIAYLIAFASDLAPICKHWANECFEKTIKYVDLNENVYFQIELYNPSLREKLIKAVEAYNYKLSIDNNIINVSD
jgi:hypothetical protein